MSVFTLTILLPPGIASGMARAVERKLSLIQNFMHLFNMSASEVKVPPIFSVISLIGYAACMGGAYLYGQIHHPELSTQGWGFGWLGVLAAGLLFPTPITLTLAIIGLKRWEHPRVIAIIAILVSLPGAIILAVLLL